MRRVKTALPDLWHDWCAATGTDAKKVDRPVLAAFTRQARPPRRVLRRLELMLGDADPAPAWPRAHRDDTNSLRRLVRRADVLIRDRATHWVLRLRLRRMLFAAVLLAPASHGGLGLDRSRALRLEPGTLDRLRPMVGTAEDPAACPACAATSWLDVLGTNYGWSRGGVRSLAHRRDEPSSAEHRHLRDDPAAEWRLCPALLPAIDRWGWIEQYASMHPSSLSAVVQAMTWLLEGDEPEPTPQPEPLASARTISDEERERIFARADELNARMEAILRDYA